MVQRIKVEVIARFAMDGSITSLQIIWSDGRTFDVDRVLAASLYRL